jgi:hypothetical protein
VLRFSGIEYWETAPAEVELSVGATTATSNTPAALLTGMSEPTIADTRATTRKILVNREDARFIYTLAPFLGFLRLNILEKPQGLLFVMIPT